MISVTNIGSGSKGNSALLRFGNDNYLFDAGLSCKKVVQALAQHSLELSDLSGIFITHEHVDHTKGLKVLLKKHDIPIFCSQGTSRALATQDLDSASINVLTPHKEKEINNLRCHPFRTPHDATEPIGMRFEYAGKTITIATDMGHVTTEIVEHCQNAEILCLESNYDERMLMRCRYPDWIKHRIKSSTGHLPNEGVRGILSKLKKIPQALFLIHLSQESNTPELALSSLIFFFNTTGSDFKKTKVILTQQDCASETFSMPITSPEPASSHKDIPFQTHPSMTKTNKKNEN